ARDFGEADRIACVLSAEHGAWRGLVRGGAGRRHGGTWQAGNLLAARWAARLSDQLGGLSGELVHPAAALAMDSALASALLAAACALADAALPEREPHPRIFAGLFALISRLALGPPLLADLVRWELALLADLGYGLDLSACAQTGTNQDLRWVSPRTGRAVSESAAGPWRARLLPLPAFLREDTAGEPAQWRDGLRLTGHFLARDVFGAQHRALPPARTLLYERVEAIARAEQASTTHA
ncbi:MAG: DNA repair protein RecO, partial [Acetobacteraceae bacterium]